MIQKFEAGEIRYWVLITDIGVVVWNMYVPMRGRQSWQRIPSLALFDHMPYLMGKLVQEVGRVGLQCIRIKCLFLSCIIVWVSCALLCR